MNETMAQVLPPPSAGKPSLLIRICGQPPRFSPEYQLLNWVAGTYVIISILFGAENMIIGVPLVWPMFGQALVYAIFFYLGRVRRMPLKPLSTLVFAPTILALSAAWFANDGIDGSTFFYFLSVFLAMLSVVRGRWSVAWVSLMLVEVVTLIGLQSLHPEWVTPYASETARRIDLAFGFFSIAAYMMGYVAVNLYNLDARRKVADELLLNVLPELIAEKLEYSPSEVIADRYPEASILFADVVNFTPMTASMMPEELVELLNEVFCYFDTLTEKYRVEKIKTIGDCYMVAAGVPSPRADHAQALARMALEMQDFVSRKEFLGKRLVFRTGINSGPVVAGVIGRKKFIYDLWGDTVNTASRMESHGTAGAIQITRNTYELIKDAFVCQPRGCIPVKGKGEMEIWHVLGAM